MNATNGKRMFILVHESILEQFLSDTQNACIKIWAKGGNEDIKEFYDIELLIPKNIEYPTNKKENKNE